MISATYSPEDNKLRLYPATRLDAETYARVKSAGFIWAPKQGLFVAPAWTPHRADLCEELAGSIDDEDTSLVDRAEERADRFGDYSEKRHRDAEQAHNGARQIMDGIPLGQPILVGHHSERHARKDAERIENGLRKAVKMWETSKYWTARAAGALRHAKYKERPDVRHRRIKGIESDRRKTQKSSDSARDWIRAWGRIGAPAKDGTPATEELIRQRALTICNYQHISIKLEGAADFVSSWSLLNDGRIDVRTAQLRSLKAHGRTIAGCRRWLQHYDLRLAYERAMLAESGGLAVQRADVPVQVGGRVRVGSEWSTVLRLNRKAGELVSVTTNRRYCRVIGIEEIAEVQAPAEGQAEAVAAALKKAPLCNYPGPNFDHMTKVEWERTYKDYKGSKTLAATETHAAHRVRSRVKGYSGILYVFVTDMPEKWPEKLAADPDERIEETPPPKLEAPTPDPLRYQAAVARGKAEPSAADAPFEQLRQQLRHGGPIVQVVSAPQLFPTPVSLARDMVSRLTRDQLHGRILEPQAGTGRLLDALREARGHLDRIYAVELNSTLAQQLRERYPVPVTTGDFLEYKPAHGYDAIVSNPPFKDAADIAHIKRAFELLNPGGRMVAICAGGPRQHAQLKTFVEERGGEWEELPAGTFEESGTSVSTVLLVVDAPELSTPSGRLF